MKLNIYIYIMTVLPIIIELIINFVQSMYPKQCYWVLSLAQLST